MLLPRSKRPSLDTDHWTKKKVLSGWKVKVIIKGSRPPFTGVPLTLAHTHLGEAHAPTLLCRGSVLWGLPLSSPWTWCSERPQDSEQVVRGVRVPSGWLLGCAQAHLLKAFTPLPPTSSTLIPSKSTKKQSLIKKTSSSVCPL